MALKHWIKQQNPNWTDAELLEAEARLLRYFENLYLIKKGVNI